LYPEHEEREKCKNYEQEIEKFADSLYEKLIPPPPVSLKTGKNWLEKTKITMTFEKLYYSLCGLFSGG